MQLLSFDEILTLICDEFDKLISPSIMARANTNIVYLLFKATAKGLEVINNVVVTLNNKFNPKSCSPEDLNSVADLVGTKKYAGSASGLNITITNNGDSDTNLLAGEYFYALDDDTIFSFEVVQNRLIPAEGSVTYIAFSEKIGSYPVTQQNTIVVTSEQTIPDTFTFSCGDNTALLGTTEETDVEFRKRINTDTTRQDSLVELQTTLKNLPYIFDCCIYFNNTDSAVEYGGYTVPPYTMVIFYSGEAKNEIAGIVASKGIYPTLQTETSIELRYENDVFAVGYYPVYITPFSKEQYKATIHYKINSVYADPDTVEAKIRTALFNTLNTQIHYDYVKEGDIYNIIESLDIAGIDILNVDLTQNDEPVGYISVPKSRIPELTFVSFART